MKILRNKIHGVMYADDFTETHKDAGWEEITESELASICGSGTPAETKSEDGQIDFEVMTKRELEIYARDFNDKDGNPIELDRLMSKKNMLKDFNERL